MVDITRVLATASEQDIQNYRGALRKLKQRTSADLQQRVYQNRNHFIKISNEAEKLREEMATLRGLMGELTNALNQTNANGPSPATSADELTAVKRSNRSSLANLESMWNNQLHSLWKTIESSQKFLPATPGRHIVLEQGWIELDAATWKPKRPVHIVLLNDHLLIAGKKRRRIDPNNPPQGPAPTKLVAEDCWMLQDVDLFDLSTGMTPDGSVNGFSGLPNAIAIRVGTRSWTFRADPRTPNFKNEFVTTFRRTVEDLRKLMRNEIEGAIRSREKPEAPSGRSSGQLDSFTRDKTEILVDVDGRQQTMRWVESQFDELDIEVALQRFDPATGRIEKLRRAAKSIKTNVSVRDVVLARIDERALNLADVLARELVDTHSFLYATQTKVEWLTRLGFEDRARTIYLQARSDIIDKRIRQCVFEGDLPIYIFELCFVYFTLIKNTFSIFQQSFPPATSSACVRWAKLQVDGFNEMLARQLSSVEPGSQVWDACAEIVRHHASELTSVGVDFSNLVGKGVLDQ